MLPVTQPIPVEQHPKAIVRIPTHAFRVQAFRPVARFLRDGGAGGCLNLQGHGVGLTHPAGEHANATLKGAGGGVAEPVACSGVSCWPPPPPAPRASMKFWRASCHRSSGRLPHCLGKSGMAVVWRNPRRNSCSGCSPSVVTVMVPFGQHHIVNQDPYRMLPIAQAVPVEQQPIAGVGGAGATRHRGVGARLVPVAGTHVCDFCPRGLELNLHRGGLAHPAGQHTHPRSGGNRGRDCSAKAGV